MVKSFFACNDLKWQELQKLSEKCKFSIGDFRIFYHY